MLLAPISTIAAEDPTFHFDEETHTYTLRGKVLPSITQILDEVGYVDKKYFTEAHRYRGQYVHWCIRLINEGTLDREDIDPQYAGYVTAYERAVADLGIRATLFERPLYHPTWLFAGTPDIVTDEAIWELKTGEIMEWVALQTIGQELLVRAWELHPRRRRRYGLRLNKDGTYCKPVEFKSWMQDEAVFKNNNATVQNKPLYGASMLRGLPCKK